MNFAGKFQFSHFGAEFQSGVDLAPGEGLADGGHTVVIPDAHLLFSGDYKRAGLDLVLSKDGHDHVVADYFKGAQRATLASPDGAHLSGELVTALTGEVQVAQLGGGATAAAAVIGHVTKLTGSATAIRNGVSIQLNMGDNVQKGDVVQAGADSTLGLTFIDGTVFGLSANARMVLNEMVYDPNGSSNSSLLSLVQGTITFVAGETAKHGDMRVDTPVATMGIRGTAVLVEIGFEVPGQGNAPPVKFQVLVEPGGKVGSYVLYSKSDPTLVIGTVNTAGQVTAVTGNGDATTTSAPPLSPEAIAILGPVFQQYFGLPSPNPRGTSPGGGGSAPSDPNSGTAPEPLKFNPFQDLPPEVPKTVPINVPGAPAGTPPITVTLTKLNTPPVIETAKVTVAEGSTVVVTTANFSVTDPDSTSFTFKVSNVTHGTFQIFNGVAWIDASSFTTADLDAGHVRFVHDGSGAAPSFSVQADDGVVANNLSGVVAGTVDFTPVNSAPVITLASLAVAEGGTVVLTAANIGVVDPDSSSFTFTVSNFAHGTFEILVGTNWVAATTFTTADLNAGHVRFVHDGGEAAPTFSIQADDGASANHLSSVIDGTVAFTHVNDVPVITAASLTVGQGGVVVLGLANISITDPDSTSFTYSAAATHGHFESSIDGTTWVPATLVTTADLAAGHVRFVADGSGIAPTIVLTASDGVATSAPFVATVTFVSTVYHLDSSAGVSIDISDYGATNGFVLPGAGNVTTPGTPEDRIVLGYDLGDSHVLLQGAPLEGDRDFTPISNTQTSTADGSSVATLLGAGNGVTLTQTITLGADANFFTTTIDIFNGGTSTLNNVRFLRSFDPDQDVEAHGDFQTYNDVVHVPTALEPFAIVSATGIESGVQVALIGLAGNWRGSVYGFTNTDPYAAGAYDAPVDPNGAAADLAISLTYVFGAILAGATATVTYITTTNVATAGSNALFGTDNADTIDGLGGDDLLIGLGGNDTFVFAPGSGHDTILDFAVGADQIDAHAYSGLPADFATWQSAGILESMGGDTLVHLSPTDTILLKGVAIGSLSAADFGMTAINHPAVLSSDTRNLTETNSATDISSSGTLTISDDDSPATFVAQTGTAGLYGTFVIGTDGAWTYTASSAHDEFVGGTTYTDTFDVTSADGTHTSVTINILGTNEGPATNLWTGGAHNGNWSDPANWSLGVVPAGSQIVEIDAQAPPPITFNLSGTVNIAELHIAAGAELDLTGTGTLNVGVLTNNGDIELAPGTTLEVNGVVQNTGDILIDDHYAGATLLIDGSVTLEGGGTVTLDGASDRITGTFSWHSHSTLENFDNTIDGYGKLGDGHLNLINDSGGTIDATNSRYALVIDTGYGSFTNHGLIESTANGGLKIEGNLFSDGMLKATAGVLDIDGNVTGHGHASIDGGTLEFGGASDSIVHFSGSSSDELVLDRGSHFTGTVSGLSSGDAIDLQGVAPWQLYMTQYSGAVQVHYGRGTSDYFTLTDPGVFNHLELASDHQGGTELVWNNDAPELDTSSAQLTHSQHSNSYKISGVSAFDSDASSGDIYTLAIDGQPDKTGSLASLDHSLDDGFTFTTLGSGQAKVGVTLTDSFGASDHVNFIFNAGTPAANATVTLTGTTSNDVIFATANAKDVLTGGGGSDQFVFGPMGGKDVITDFRPGVDKIELDHIRGVPSLSGPFGDLQLFLWEASHGVEQQGNNTLIHLDGSNTLQLNGVHLSQLHASDFIVHPYSAVG